MYIKLAIADDHPMVISGIKHMLQYYRHIEITNSWNSGRELLEGLAVAQPDVLLLDLQLPDISGNELARIITRRYPGIRILVITSMESTFHIKDMMKSGCKGYLLKTTSPDILLAAIEEVYHGREYLDALLKEQLLQQVLKKKGPASSLTRREKEILSLIAQELTSHEIAAQLSISQRTVENHRFSLMQKLNAKNTVSLIKISLEKGLI